MIIEKQPLPEDPTPADSPPLYETLNAVNAGYPSSKGLALSSSPSSPKSRSITSSPSSGLFFNNKGKGRTTNWFNFFASRTAREVRNTISGLIRDLIQEQHSSFPGTAREILESCADACISHSLSLSTILQEKSIENHTPLYWAIVKHHRCTTWEGQHGRAFPSTGWP